MNPQPVLMEAVDIAKLLPHRFPFLLVDRVLEITDTGIRALKNVTVNEPFFPGHFPHEPVMPGVLQLEAMAQAAGIWAMKKWGLDARASVYFLTIDKAKFRATVRPGDSLVLEATILKQSGSRLFFHARALLGDKLASEAEMLAMVKKPD